MKKGFKIQRLLAIQAVSRSKHDSMLAVRCNILIKAKSRDILINNNHYKEEILN